MQVSKFKVSGMTCGGCVRSIEHGLGENPNIKKVKVSLADKILEVESDLENAAIIELIEELGYEGEVI